MNPFARPTSLVLAALLQAGATRPLLVSAAVTTGPTSSGHEWSASHRIASPAAPGAMGSALTTGPDGVIYLSWLEPAGGDTWALKFSRYDGPHRSWAAAQTIAQGSDWLINWADFPVLAVLESQLVAVWSVSLSTGGHGHHEESYHAMHSISNDGGVSWSRPEPLTRLSNSVEFVALLPLPDGRLLAAWLDGRHRTAGQDRQSLYARALGTPGPDLLVDDSVCDCCQLSLAPTPAGGAVLAYRGRTADEVRDIRYARFNGQSWNRPRELNPDGWKISGCPVNGPQLAAQGDRMGAVWFTAAENQARVLARLSNDGGNFFGPVQRIDLGRPQGRVDSVLLADGTLVMTWLESTGAAAEANGGIYLRSLSPEGRLSEPRLIVPSSTNRMSGFPRIALASARSVLLTCTQDREPSPIATFLIEVE
jgi:BNR repeat-like domain